MQYVEAPIVIDNNVWIGANTVILKGTSIGANAAIAAGSIVRGVMPEDSLFYNKHIEMVVPINR